MRYVIYWGCTIKVMYPSVEKAAKIVLDRLGINYVDAVNVSCCPVPEVFYIRYPRLWEEIARSNLETLRSQGEGILVICNGCWETFRLVSGNGTDVHHIIEVLYKRRRIVEANIKRRLSGIRFAVQPGCRLYIRSELIDMFKELVKVLGAEIVEWRLEKICCGEPLRFYSEDIAVKERALPKVKDALEHGADAFITFCPGCMLQLEAAALLSGLQIPAINYLEALAVAMGIDPHEIGVQAHLTSTRTFIERVVE